MKQRHRRPTRQPADAAEGADALFALLEAAGTLSARLEKAMGAVGLSMAKYGVLRLLADAPEPMTLTELASHEGCVRSNMTQLVDRLEADGLVRRVDDPHDRRVVRAMLTPAGREKAEAGGRVLGSLQREVSRLLSAQDRAAVARVRSALK